MKLQVRYANHPDDSKHYTTADLRRHYLMEKVFEMVLKAINKNGNVLRINQIDHLLDLKQDLDLIL